VRYFLSLFFFCFFAFSAQAHEVRPAFLSITETAPAEFTVLWKQPVLDGKRLKIKPTFPDECTVSHNTLSRQAGTVIDSRDVFCTLTEGEISLPGLERTLTDVFAQITYGVEHILLGWDHLLFVIGLTLLVSRRQILGVATAFTLAHSITLILIAASIVLLGVEIMRKQQGHKTLATQRPYLISFFIGLIHGCGFASALSEIGLPKGTELLALLLFNIGVELGQFAVIFIALVLLGLS